VASGVTTRRGSQERNAGTDGKHPMLDPRAEAGKGVPGLWVVRGPCWSDAAAFYGLYNGVTCCDL
jgi:hypothetical protein